MRAGYALFFYGAGCLVWVLAIFEERLPPVRRLGLKLVPLGLLLCFLPTAIQTLKEHLRSGPDGLF